MANNKFFALVLGSGAVVVSVAFALLVNMAVAQPAGGELHGWGWSGDIGWISFNCADTPSGCSASNYKVSYDASGNLSGYAWSNEIGWLSFNRADAGTPPSGGGAGALASFNTAGGTMGGWARFLTAKNPVDNTWDGWVKLSNITYNSASNKFSGYAWGDLNVGWINFSKVGTNPIAPPSKADLVVTSLSSDKGAPVEGDTVTFNAIITNIGADATAPFNNEFNISGGTFISAGLGGLTAGNSAPVSGTWIAVKGNHTVRLCADSGGVIGESDESNNCTSITVNVTASGGGLPLSVSCDGVSPNPATAGNTVTWSASVSGGTGMYDDVYLYDGYSNTKSSAYPPPFYPGKHEFKRVYTASVVIASGVASVHVLDSDGTSASQACPFSLEVKPKVVVSKGHFRVRHDPIHKSFGEPDLHAKDEESDLAFRARAGLSPSSKTLIYIGDDPAYPGDFINEPVKVTFEKVVNEYTGVTLDSQAQLNQLGFQLRFGESATGERVDLGETYKISKDRFSKGTHMGLFMFGNAEKGRYYIHLKFEAGENVGPNAVKQSILFVNSPELPGYVPL